METPSNRPRSMYQYSPRLSGQNCKFLKFLLSLNVFCLSIPKRDWDTKKTAPNMGVCRGSHGAMLEY